MTDTPESITCVHLTDEMRRNCPRCNPSHMMPPADLARPMTVAEAARVLLDVFEDPMHNAPHGFDWQSMYDEMSEDHKESMEICGHHDWPSILTVALRALSQGGE